MTDTAPYPLTLVELHQAQKCVQTQVEFYADCGVDDDELDDLILCVAVWNALEQHIAHLEDREPLPLIQIMGANVLDSLVGIK